MIKTLQTQIGIDFKNPALLENAFIHRSYLNEAKGDIQHNERLEFLGDAVLELIVTEYLYQKFPTKPEGEMTALRSALVKGETLAEIAKELEFGNYLKLSKGEARSGGSEKPYLLANTFEAVLGAIYLDAGFDVSQKFVAKYLLPNLEKIIAEGSQVDAKSRFQEIAQEKLAITPRYDLLNESGPDHDKVFEMGAYIGKDLYGKGKGVNKQSAEQAAATEALKKLL
jgi:ribonuclease-3